ncbi:lachesin-like isoform X2 [Hylaeus anthracinus]|uniref:lachesin-like isoform X2 n=1 Tax=Hylaeus volcanicus TaxID=313075 RepID=UPI0023B842C1|nr:lachesin-like isoform X2 [Hylaeus volcanicus]XP_053996818.1 lachesin-like isoform X2 [Hylaeus anthracinus]
MLPVLAISVFCIVTWASALNDPSPDSPRFGKPLNNLTVSVGREAIFTCIVENLGIYKVAWLRVDTQTILTIAVHVITKNHRISVKHSGHRTWSLHIKDIKVSDRGWYMCQLNTDPMSSITGFLEVVVPPDILDYPTSTDMVVREGSNVTLQCAATGIPTPTVTWRREAEDKNNLSNWREVQPMVWIENQLVGAYEGETLKLECRIEAYPRPITYWTRPLNKTITNDNNYKVETISNGYEITMRLTIHSVRSQDFGSFRCVATNSLGETDGKLKVYSIDEIPTTRRPNTGWDSKKARKIDHSHERKTAGMKDEPILNGIDYDDEQIDFQSATASSLFHRHLFANLGITAVTAILVGGLST